MSNQYPQQMIDALGEKINIGVCRLRYYEHSGFTKEAFHDEDDLIRTAAYRALGYTEEALKDKDWLIRLEGYRVLGFTRKALSDEFWLIRLEAYRVKGFTKKAFKDEYWLIRLEAYRALGFTEEALNDNDHFIRREADLYFKAKKPFLHISSVLSTLTIIAKYLTSLITGNFNQRIVEQPFNHRKIKEFSDSQYKKGFFLTANGRRVVGLDTSTVTSSSVSDIMFEIPGVIEKSENYPVPISSYWNRNGECVDGDDNHKLRMFVLQ